MKRASLLLDHVYGILSLTKAPHGFRGKVGHCQDNEKSRCLVISSLSCPIDRPRKKRLFLILSNGQGPKFKFFQVGNGATAEVSQEPAGSQLPVAQNNLHTTEAHLG